MARLPDAGACQGDRRHARGANYPAAIPRHRRVVFGNTIVVIRQKLSEPFNLRLGKIVIARLKRSGTSRTARSFAAWED
jgi:hypothetical protein